MAADEPDTVLVRVAARAAPQRLGELRRRLRNVIRRPFNARASTRWVEVVVFGEGEPERVARLLQEAGLTVLEAYRVKHSMDSEGLMERYRRLLREEKYWEAHVAGEEAWHRVGTAGRVLAVLAGALARAQEGGVDAALKMIEKARQWSREAGVEELVDWDCVRRAVLKTWQGLRGDPLSCMEPLISSVETLIAKDKALNN